MTKEQALENLFAAAKQAAMPYEAHALMQKSYETLKEAISNKET